MQQMWLEGPGRLAWREVETPRLEGGDALVRPLAVALCDADAAAWAGNGPLPVPYALGHEFVAAVIEAAPGVQHREGDVVVVPFQLSCGSCGPCAAGRTGSCATVPRLSMYGFGALGGPWGSAFADVVRVPYADHMLIPLPGGVSPVAAANASDNLADAWRTVAPWLRGPTHDVDVLVVGGGVPSIGLWSAELAVRLEAGRVSYLDTDPRRLALAEDSGAQPIEGTPERRFEEHRLTVDASGSPDGLRCCLRSTTPDGTCVSPSIYFEDPSLPLLEMYSKNVTFVTGRPHSRTLLPETIDAIATGLIDPTRIATMVGPDEIEEALRSGAPKIIVTLEQT